MSDSKGSRPARTAFYVVGFFVVAAIVVAVAVELFLVLGQR